jgi:hypothetical protein
MIHPPRRDRQARAIAEVLALIADAYPDTGPERPRLSYATYEQTLSEDATEFGAALERFSAGFRHRISGKPTRRGRSGIPGI